MAEIRVNPTRMEMKRIQTRYQTARKGHKLLKDKRDELMKQFLDVVREDKLLRERVEASLADFYRSFTVASAPRSATIIASIAMPFNAKRKLRNVGYSSSCGIVLTVR